MPDTLGSDRTEPTSRDDAIERLFEEQEKRAAQDAPRVPFRPYDIVVLVIFLGLFAVVFLQFFTRYALNDSISWTEEAARYLLICLAFVGAIKCQIIESHIRLEFVDQWLGDKVKYLQIFALICLLGFGVFGVWSVFELIQRTSFQSMISLPFPKYYLYLVILAALAIFSAVCASQLVKALKDLRA